MKTSAIVGSYDVKVLRAVKADDLNAWLDENGFASLPAAAEETVADYISKGWVFAAIRLTRAESGLNAPHPIKLVFPAQQPVYPLKLTSLAGGSPLLEIFVIADRKASCDLLETDYCDRFSKRTINKSTLNSSSPGETQVFFQGDNTDNRIGHPLICQLMWDGCVLTKFSGTVPSDQMTSDMEFSWQPFRTFQHHFYTVQGAQTGWIVFIWLAGSHLFVTLIVWKKRIRQAGGWKEYLAFVLLPPIAVYALCGWIFFSSLSRIDNSEITIKQWMSRRLDPGFLYWDIKDVIQHSLDTIARSEQRTLPIIC